MMYRHKNKVFGLSKEDFYQAFKAKDSRFDVQVFIGVSSTGMCSRPVLPYAKIANYTFFATTTEAEKALRYLWWVALLHPLEHVAPRWQQDFGDRRLRSKGTRWMLKAGMLARLFKRSHGGGEDEWEIFDVWFGKRK